jgi:hypothetical protein
MGEKKINIVLFVSTVMVAMGIVIFTTALIMKPKSKKE